MLQNKQQYKIRLYGIDCPESGQAVLVEFYGPVEMSKVDRYLDILVRLKEELGEIRNAN